MKTADQILKDHEDANEMHFHQVDREWIIEAMEEYAKTTRPWIRPQDQMPKDGERVLVCNEIGIKSVASYDTYYNEWNSDDSFWWPREVTHWMPLHDPPTAAKPLLAAAVPCSHEDIYLRKSGIWKCKQCGKVFY